MNIPLPREVYPAVAVDVRVHLSTLIRALALVYLFMAYEYNPANDPEFGQTAEPAPLTAEQRQANSANQSARGRQSRHEHTSSFGDTGHHDVEVELSNVQKLLSNGNLNPAERASLENKPWLLAGTLDRW
ncbi:hypothetical protein OAZ06_04065 [Synechococcus sp. AH-736-G20]|nr:hypothetical protein [Synechococcus sp. AH-736-G20]